MAVSELYGTNERDEQRMRKEGGKKKIKKNIVSQRLINNYGIKMYVCMWRGGVVLMSALYEGEFSKLSPKKINVDSGGTVSIFGSDIIDHCGIKKFI